MIIGTAGHVDHGKSALVTALTGQRMDRLPQERSRGITIDLNFAALRAPGRAPIGIVDVPGHRDFVRTMAAGASGVDVALLVVAADSGPQPQTEEHLRILEQFGVGVGVAVVTKADLAEPEWLALVQEDVAARLASSSIAFGPVLAASTRDPGSVADVRAALLAAADRVAPRPSDDVFRMWVDRGFSVSGAGTVVTGTVQSGAVEQGMELRLEPAGVDVRVRALEVFGAPATRAEAGSRVAIALPGVPTADVRRGAVLMGAATAWRPAMRVDIALTLDTPGAVPARRCRVEVLVGTARTLAWLSPRAPEPGAATVLARVALGKALPLAAGDRLVLRRPSPPVTLGGGIVIDPDAERGMPWPAELGAADDGARLGALLRRRQIGIAEGEARRAAGPGARQLVRQLQRAGEVVVAGGRLVAPATIEQGGARMLAALARFHAAHQGEQGMSLETLRRQVPSELAEAVMQQLLGAGRIAVRDATASLAGFRPSVRGGDAIVAMAVERVAAGGLEPPDVEELGAALGRPDVAGILRLAARDGTVVQVTPSRFVAAGALEAVRDAIAALPEGEPVTPAALRQRLGLSRKYLMPLLEWADREGLTYRQGDSRFRRPLRGQVQSMS